MPVRSDLPTGTVTFLFTDIEGSTQLVHSLGERYAAVLDEHHGILRNVWSSYGGVEVDTAGDAFFVAFAEAPAAVAAAAAAQVALEATPVRVRMGLHTGTPQLAESGYVGIDVHKAARIAGVAHGRQVLLSAATSELVDLQLRDLGAHRLKDLLAPEHLFQLGDEEFPTLKTRYVTNLPAEGNPIIGRSHEIAELVALVRDGNRLVTLTGAGGSGKTRLALNTAAELVERFPDGVWFVALSAVVDPGLVEPTIAQALDARAGLRDELRQKRLLLVLDNLEQILGAAPVVADLLAEAPGLVVLATSRERLALAAEREYPLAPLAIDDGSALFTERARRLVPSFEPDGIVDEIVRRLDGLPLAVELAAARVKVMTSQAILDRIGRSLDLLSGGGRDAPARQRTLRATIEWSHQLLSGEERELFRRLAVFPASFDLEATEEIVGASIDDLGALIEKSLVRFTESGRYFMLETIRTFAIERLEEGPGSGALREEHATWFARLAARLEPGLRDARQADVIGRLTLEQPNLRAALDTLHAADDPRLEATLAADCSYFWYLTGQLQEGLSRLRAAYERMHGREEVERGRAANGLALITFMTGDAKSSGRLAEEALTFCARHGDVPGILRALTGKLAAAESPGEARALASEQVDIARIAGERWYEALGLCNAGVSERQLGNLERSRELTLESLEVALEVGDVQIAVGSACNAAHAELLLGDLRAAKRRFGAAVALLAARPLPEMAIWCLDGLAAVAARDGDAEWGARLLGGAEQIVASTSYGHPDTRLELARTRAALEQTLGVERAAALRGEGAGFELAAVIDLALQEGSSARLI